MVQSVGVSSEKDFSLDLGYHAPSAGYGTKTYPPAIPQNDYEVFFFSVAPCFR
jgi:hypothetical protein